MVSRHTLAACCCTILALTATPALAGGGSQEWASLDREIAALAQEAAQAQAPEGVRVGLVLRTNYAWFQESPEAGVDDYSGFVLDNVRPRLDGQVGDYSIHVEFEAQSGSVILLDAIARWDFTEAWALGLGQDQIPTLRSGLMEPEHLLFILRTAPGQFWQLRDQGVYVEGTLGPVDLVGSLENGGDGVGNDYAYTLRGDWNLLGGGVRLVEGAYGSGRETCLSVGASYHDDQSAADDGDFVAVDAVLTTGPFYVWGEWMQFGDDAVLYDTFADTSPWALAASFMLDPEKWELAARYEVLDDVNNVKALTLGVNRYMAGHDAKWVLNFADAASDLGNQDGIAVALGLTVNV